MQPLIRCALALVALGLLSSCASYSPPPGTFQFAVLGDMPYDKPHEQEYLRVLADINGADVAFVVHLGDFQGDPRLHNENPSSASLPCVGEYYDWILGTFQSVRHPFVLTPGDNDWTDCHSLRARKADPLQLLDRVRTTFFPEGRSLGQVTMPVINQSADPRFRKFRENLRWTYGGVTFATLHIVGSNDNFGRTPENDAEHAERKAANIAWIKEAFARARAADTVGLVLLTQANPAFENSWPAMAQRNYTRMVAGARPPAEHSVSVYDDYVTTLSEELETYERPVAFVHGDTHRFRVDQPLFSRKTTRPFDNFTRIETFGYPEAHWILMSVQPGARNLFQVSPMLLRENSARSPVSHGR